MTARIIRIGVFHGWWCFLTLGVLLPLGCSRSDPPEKPPEGEEATVEDYGTLPGLKGAPHKKLQDELARITEEGGTPAQLDQHNLPDEQNAAAGLLNLFPEKTVKALRQRSDELFPSGKFDFNAIQLEKAIRFRKTYEAQRHEAREALARPGCDFGVRHLAGPAADLSFIDVVWICARLEAFAAAEALSRDHDLDAAIESVRFMLRLAECLGAEKRISCRLEAAYLRTEALGVIQAILRRSELTAGQVASLAEITRDVLRHWPDDAAAWIGDRALGMYCYELVRAGHIYVMLTARDREQFAREHSLRELPAAAQRSANQDELYYLETMRKIIESCARPYFQRMELFEAMRQELQDLRETDRFPLVAARLLLVDMEKAHEVQARDRANYEAMALALALASGGEPLPLEVNPLTGEKYKIQRLGNLVTVGNIGTGNENDAPTFAVPDLGKADAATTREGP